jgi:arylsulfatase A-like enzyme
VLTGRYPQRNGLNDMIRNNEVNYGHRFTEEEYAVSPEMTLGLDLREITIAQVLREAGYATGVFGKWDSGRAKRFLPQQRGFDTFFGFANTGIDYFTHERYGVPSMFRGNERVKVEGYATDLFRREAIEFLNKNARRPFFLYIPFNAPHGASNLERVGVQAPDEYYRMYGDLPPNNTQKYMAATTAMDDAIGKILDELDRLGVAENTLVIFFSDNGGSGGVARNTPLRGHKAQMWEGGLRVPFLARWPGRLAKGKVSDEFLSSLEVFPTLTAAAGARLPANVTYDGFDMLPVLAGLPPSSPGPTSLGV